MSEPRERITSLQNELTAGESEHPPDLMDRERPYIVQWGWREAILMALGALLLVIFLGFLGIVSSPFWLLLLVPVIFAGATGVLFFRNPRRRIPPEPGIFLAPADGRVVEVSDVEEEEYIAGRASKVGIFMSIFNAHLTRVPCSGRVEYLRHRPGKFLDARHPNASRENESQAIGILRRDSGGPLEVKVLVRQVAGAVARRIVCPLRDGMHLARGRLLGMIKFGSRTEVFVSRRPGDPPLEIMVEVGDRVRAGETVLFRYGDTETDLKST